jgi:hypothetical protein
LICTILGAEPTIADLGKALLKIREPAIHSAVAAVLCTPWIILRFGRFFNADDADANSQHEQQELHGRLLVAPRGINANAHVLFPAPPEGQGATDRGEAAIVRTQLRGTADCGEHREAAGAIEA